jgi:hypothetical protein
LIELLGEKMNKKMRVSLFFAAAAGAAVVSVSLEPGHAQSSDETSQVVGLVRDIACPLQNTKSTTTSYSKDCIVQCAKAGSPLGILTADGATYLPVTTTMPDMGQDRLKPYVGEMVEAKGKVFERNGGHAIEIKEIHKLPAASADK